MAGALSRFFEGDVWHAFRTSPVAIVAAVVALACLVVACFAEVLAPR